MSPRFISLLSSTRLEAVRSFTIVLLYSEREWVESSTAKSPITLSPHWIILVAILLDILTI